MKKKTDRHTQTHTVNKSYGLITYKNLIKHENCYDSILTATKPYRKLKRICDKTKQPRKNSMTFLKSSTKHIHIKTTHCYEILKY